MPTLEPDNAPAPIADVREDEVLIHVTDMAAFARFLAIGDGKPSAAIAVLLAEHDAQAESRTAL
jgi:hypothetical protein